MFGATNLDDDICENIQFTYSIYNYFYDKECLRDTRVNDVCGMKIVNSVLDRSFGQLRIETQVMNFLCLTLMVIILQIGGIPIPSRTKPIGVLFWFSWMVCLILQIAVLIFAIIVSIMAFGQLHHEVNHCANEWKPNISLIDALIYSTLPFQPPIMYSLLLITIYWRGIVEGMKVLYGARGYKTRFKATWVKYYSLMYYFSFMGNSVAEAFEKIIEVHNEQEEEEMDENTLEAFNKIITFSRGLVRNADEDLPIDVYLGQMLQAFQFAWTVPFGILITFSAMFLFTFLYLPMYAFNFFVITWLTAIIIRTLMSFVKSMMPICKQFCCAKKLRRYVREFTDSLWWLSDDKQSIFTGSFRASMLNLFQMVNSYAPAVLAILTALFIYGGHSHDTNMKLVHSSYEFCFGFIKDFHFQIPSIFHFDFSSLTSLYFYEESMIIIGDLLHNVTVMDCIHANKSLMLINFLISMFKVIISTAELILAFCDSCVYDPVSFAIIASVHTDDWDDKEGIWCRAVQKVIDRENIDSDEEDDEEANNHQYHRFSGDGNKNNDEERRSGVL